MKESLVTHENYKGIVVYLSNWTFSNDHKVSSAKEIHHSGPKTDRQLKPREKHVDGMNIRLGTRWKISL
jgi:hypothetical protein